MSPLKCLSSSTVALAEIFALGSKSSFNYSSKDSRTFLNNVDLQKKLIQIIIIIIIIEILNWTMVSQPAGSLSFNNCFASYLGFHGPCPF